MIDKSKFDWKKYITECLESTVYCVLGTQDDDRAWVCPVNFAYDKDLNFYFLSRKTSRHSENIFKNPHVSVAIFNGAQDTNGEKRGMQMVGEAKLLEDNEVPDAFDTYFGRYGNEGKDIKNYLGNAKWKFFKSTSIDVYYFDTEFFEEERQKVPIEKLT